MGVLESRTRCGRTGRRDSYPARTKRLDYEGELAIVLGKPVKDFNAKADITPYVWGITLFGDWSIRDQTEANAPLKIGMSKNFTARFGRPLHRGG